MYMYRVSFAYLYFYNSKNVFGKLQKNVFCHKYSQDIAMNFFIFKCIL